MGIKKMFQKKEPTEEEIKDHLVKAGINTKSNSSFGGRQDKFGAFKNYAIERREQRPGLAPVNPYANIGQGNVANPYAENANGSQNQGQQNPYGAASNSQNGRQSPYTTNTGQHNGRQSPYTSQNSNPQSNPYGGQPNGQRNPYGGNSGQGNGQTTGQYPPANNPYGAATSRNNSYSSRTTATTSDPYSRRRSKESTRASRDDESIDLNDISSGSSFIQGHRPSKKQTYPDDATLDLNELPEDELDLNNEDYDDLDIPAEEQVNSEDEEVESIKQDIRFVKQESVASTRNTLRMAQEADASATNTMGMLGAQSERLYNAEQNLLLADTQTQIADEKVKELKRLNGTIFLPATGNPFNKKSRLRQQEERLKTAKAQEKYMRDANRKEMYASEQRLKSGITNNATSSELHQKYQGEKNLDAARRYQFENDSEDDEMEKELASNLDQIGLYAKKLSSSAKTMGQEVDSQNSRLRKIEEDADRLDINVHMNSTRLSNIR
ncbi:protein transport protein SEC9 plasma membrane t-SNARE [Scheffersomyces xylosifermentans]|uniref:protein transport protein SEC9 plasma membrane t-SNARE n=1 Tax=Scheffersomyces xylosifermentans TaxID=1304137 RepID=UPI00315C8936